MSNGHNVIAVTFNDPSKEYQALSALRQADQDGRVGVRGAAIIERRPGENIRIREGEDNVIGGGAAGGGLIGMLIGVLGGPVGVLLGLGAGAAIGAAVDLDRADEGDEVLTQMSMAIPVGSSALIAEVDEYAVEVVDGEMDRPRGNHHPAAGRRGPGRAGGGGAGCQGQRERGSPHDEGGQEGGSRREARAEQGEVG